MQSRDVWGGSVRRVKFTGDGDGSLKRWWMGGWRFPCGAEFEGIRRPSVQESTDLHCWSTWSMSI
eukprot:367087-Alexandrium_andersonii.AAC.1